MSARLEGKLVLITGASAGIGRAAARAFVEGGARVVGVARSADALRSLIDELGGPPRAAAIAADVTDGPGMERMAARVRDEHGLPDVIVANAGLGLDALFVETTDELWQRVFDVNVFGLVRTVRPFLQAMIERGSGRVLLISSVVGKRGIPHYSAYSASKFAVHGMAECLRSELRGTGVTVGVVCPSSTASEFETRRLHRGPRQRPRRVARHSTESVARAIVRMATSRRREHVLSIEGKAMALANKLVPGLLDHLLARILVRGKDPG